VVEDYRTLVSQIIINGKACFFCILASHYHVDDSSVGPVAL